MLLENYSVLIVQNTYLSFLSSDGELLSPTLQEAQEHIENNHKILVVHRPLTLKKLKISPEFNTDEWLDLLELAAFVFPTQSFGYTVHSFAEALSAPLPEPIEADFLFTLTNLLIEKLTTCYNSNLKQGEIIAAQLALLYQNQWNWASILLNALNITLPLPEKHLQPIESLKIWKRLPKWEDIPPRPQVNQLPIYRQETFARLSQLLGSNAENRVGQTDFTDIARYSFEPCQAINKPKVVLAEAGTGTGKTLAYIAPASLWAEKNQGTVWINTYTKHLQKQIEQEFSRLYPDPEIKQKHIIVRKGRENYLCLLNLEEYIYGNFYTPNHFHKKIAIILLSRWAETTKDGDLFGGDLPNWFYDLFDERLLYHVAERKGECLHGACPHFQTCFVECSIQKAHHADIVIANHALLMKHFAWILDSQLPDKQQNLPTRLIFDEAHHLFQAADSAYSVAFSALETSELRRWLLGNEGSNTRSKGLKKRIHDLMIDDSELEDILESILQNAHILPNLNWSNRLANYQEKETAPINPMEYFFFLIQKQILIQSPSRNYNSTQVNILEQDECDLFPLLPELLEIIPDLITILECLLLSLKQFIAKLKDKLDDLNQYDQDRIETTIGTLKRKALNPLSLWLTILAILLEEEEETAKTHFTFLKLNRKGKHLLDIGIFHHWIDPTIPLMKMLQSYTHGMLLTSATLRDESNDDTEQNWHAAEQRTGTIHLTKPPIRAALSCSFDYAKQARIYIVNDLNTSSMSELAQAYLQLFQASHGGGLGLFTAISRLRAVHQKIIEPLESKNISLFAQHVDPLNNHSLVEVFKNDLNSCLLGTDAMRDGINIPGDSLRLVVFEKVPWSRPDLLYRERKKYFSPDSPQDYEEQIVRLKLRQAFGRLIRSQSDRGIFIILDRKTPARILSAFPTHTPIQRLSLQEAVQKTQEFYADLKP